MDTYSEIPRGIFITLKYLLLLVVGLATVGNFLKLLGGVFGRPSGQRWQYFRVEFPRTLSTICWTLGCLALELLGTLPWIGKLWQSIIAQQGDAASQVADATVDV
ncbi:hypothetical protein CFAM422_000432 [Trichoderma lentiforme]|uniref:Uncharacterized protein n=1 Tax=Trichoderma lentiforme TaxID=1567552 RepID=A0A9P4XRL8_9HYPO|nr:hypothetical protein CFAM422_000432 [Trichoderma lentiforme]